MKTYCTFGNGTIFNWMFQVVKNMPSSAGIAFDVGSSPGLKRSTWIGKISWSRKYKPTPVFLPGELHGERSLVGYNPWHHEELDRTKHACMHHIKLWGLAMRQETCMYVKSTETFLSGYYSSSEGVKIGKDKKRFIPCVMGRNTGAD